MRDGIPFLGLHNQQLHGAPLGQQLFPFEGREPSPDPEPLGVLQSELQARPADRTHGTDGFRLVGFVLDHREEEPDVDAAACSDAPANRSRLASRTPIEM